MGLSGNFIDPITDSFDKGIKAFMGTSALNRSFDFFSTID
jgi:hypothetical protein